MASVTATTEEIVSLALDSSEPGLYEVVGGQIVEKPAIDGGSLLPGFRLAVDKLFPLQLNA